MPRACADGVGITAVTRRRRVRLLSSKRSAGRKWERKKEGMAEWDGGGGKRMIDQHRDDNNNDDDDECWHHLTEPNTRRKPHTSALMMARWHGGGPARLGGFGLCFLHGITRSGVRSRFTNRTRSWSADSCPMPPGCLGFFFCLPS